jgi:hypothetical protein
MAKVPQAPTLILTGITWLDNADQSIYRTCKRCGPNHCGVKVTQEPLDSAAPVAHKPLWPPQQAGTILLASPTTIFQLNDTVAPYSTNFIRTQATATSSTVLTLVTVWSDDGTSGAGNCQHFGWYWCGQSCYRNWCSHSTDHFGHIHSSSTTYLTNTWGTPSIAASVA